MELLFPIAFFIIGILVMFRIINFRGSIKYIAGVFLLFFLFPLLRIKGNEFISGAYPWWTYLVAFLAILVAIRLILDRLFPWRRRD